MSWIKVRTNLASDPKVVRISSGLVRKLSGSCPDSVRILSGSCPDPVLIMSATVGAILRIWSMADQFASDGILKGMTCETLDQYVGIPGFALEMVGVGWLVDQGDSLQLPNYQEHNGTTAKTRAMDQARKNSVRKLSGSCPDSVRVKPDKTRTREEKNKNKESNPNGLLPLTPTKTSTKFDPVADIEVPFVSAEWNEAWAKWCRHRSEIRKPLTRQATESQIDELAKMGEARAIAAIYHSLRNGWQGIFEPKADSPGAGYGHRPSATERAAESAERLINGKSSIANQIFAELQAMEGNG